MDEAPVTPVDLTFLGWFMLGAFAGLMPLQNVLAKLPDLGGGVNVTNAGLATLAVVGLGVVRPVAADPLGRRLWWVAVAFAGVGLAGVYVGGLTVGFEPASEHLRVYRDVAGPLLAFYVVVGGRLARPHVCALLVPMAAVLPYMAYVFHDQLASVWKWHYTQGLRVDGTFLDAGSNPLATFCNLVSMVLLGLVLHVRHALVRVVASGVIALAVSVVAYTYSRGGYLALVVGVLLVAVRRSPWLAVVAALVLFVGFAWLPVSIVDRIYGNFEDPGWRETGYDESVGSRFQIWADGLAQYASSPVLGIGFHGFHHVERQRRDMHNLYLQVLVELGPAGLGLFLAVLALAFTAARRLAAEARTEFDRGLGLGFMGAIAVLTVENAFGNRFWHLPISMYFWLLAGLVVNRLAETRAHRAGGAPE